MTIKLMTLGALAISLAGAPAALAQGAPAAGLCTTPPCAPLAPAARKPDLSTEPAGADPMATPADKLAPTAPREANPPGQPPTYRSSSMPTGNSMPSGSDPGSPTAPSPMPGSR